MTDIHTTDDEIDALMAELEAQDAEVMATAAPTVSNEKTPAPLAAADEDDLAAALDGLEEVPQAAPAPVAPAAPMSMAERIKAEAAKKAAALAAEDDPAFAAAAAEAEAAKKAAAEAKAQAERQAQLQAQEEARIAAEAAAAAEAKKAAAEAAAKAQAEAEAMARAKAEAEAEARAKAAAAAAAAAAPKVEPRRPTEDTPAGPSAAGLRHGIDVEQFQRDTRVTEATLDTCMTEQASLRAYYGTQAAQAEAQATRHKARFEVIEATLYDQHRKSLAKSEEKVTEKMVDNAVKMDPRWLKAKNVMIEAETIAAMNKSLVDSLRDRKDMLVQLGADRREGMKGQLRMVSDQNEREATASRAHAAAMAALGGNQRAA